MIEPLSCATPPRSASPPCLTNPAIAAVHGFFTRVGGVSTGGYASLNASLSGGDDSGAVLTNRGRIAAAIGLPADALLGVTQVHGVAVVEVTAPWPAGAGARADGMVTRRAGIGLGIITADCAPVLFVDARQGVIGAAHAGWRGAAAGVLEATLQAMTDLGARQVTACIGPCIGRASYEVGADLRDAVLAAGADGAPFFTDGAVGRWQFDLAGYCAARLERAGAIVAHVQQDTYAQPDRFYSHRRRTHAGVGPIGHQMSVIRL